jgi:diaminopropionate ammonia-lyase
MTLRLRLHQRKTDTDLPGGLSRDGFDAAAREIASWPGYAPTPLHALPRLARALGLGALWYKDEAPRFGLNSFKALGGAYAVFRQLKARVEAAGRHSVTAAELANGVHRALTEAVTVTCATDGNHGRSVAWGAQLFHCRAVIFIHEHVSEGREREIARYGAMVRRVPGTYDDSVRAAQATADKEGWIVVSDTSYPGYTEIPRDVMHGYGVMQDEVARQLGSALPTHCLVHAGVGAWAAAILARQAQLWGAQRPKFIVVEPNKADALIKSAIAGRPVVAEGVLDTVMAGLAAGEVSLLGWEVLNAGADAFLAIDDAWALQAMRRLAEGGDGDPRIVAGETGGASVAALLALQGDAGVRAKLGLGPEAHVLVFGSEGDTDPVIYRRIVGRSAAEVRGAV